MRFWAVHKLATFLVAATALIAVSMSGELDVPTVLIAAIGLVASWWVEPPRVRIERLLPLFTVMAFAAFGIAVLGALSGEFLLSGERFLVHLLVIKMLSRRAARDYQQIYVLSFLLVAGASAINVGLSFALCFLAFVVFATWALILFHLRREMEENFLLKHSENAASEKVEVERILNSRRIVGSAFLWSTSGVSVAIFALSVVMWLFFPRMGFGWLSHRLHSGVSVAGFADGVKLGGHGVIRDDDTVVMRVFLSDAGYQSTAASAGLHWRGVAFDTYEKGEWKRRTHARVFNQPRSTSFGLTTLYVARDEKPISRQQMRSAREKAVKQEIYLSPLETDVLFAASQPVEAKIPDVPWRKGMRPAALWSGNELRQEHDEQIRYEVWSDLSKPDEATLAAAPEASSKKMENFLQLPPELPPRVRELALSIVGDAKGPHAKAQRVWQYLQDNYSYTLEQETGGVEPLDYFLFERRKGHCEYFATAMAVLLRAAGVPTRNVNGFLGGEWNEYGGYLAVRNGDAHSWLEVWYDGVGWVTWDPTPAGAVEPQAGASFLDRMRRLVDSVRQSWYKWVLEYDLRRQLQLFRGIGDWFKQTRSALSLKSTGVWLREHKAELGGAILGLAAVCAAVIFWRQRRQRGPASARRGSDDPVVKLYGKTAHWLGRRSFVRAPGQTPREHAHALLERASPGARSFSSFTELYYRARWADVASDRTADLAEAERLAREIRDAVAEARRAARAN